MNCHSASALAGAVCQIQKWFCSHMQQVLSAYQGQCYNGKTITEALEVLSEELCKGWFGRSYSIWALNSQREHVQIFLTQDRHKSFHSLGLQRKKSAYEQYCTPAQILLCLNKHSFLHDQEINRTITGKQFDLSPFWRGPITFHYQAISSGSLPLAKNCSFPPSKDSH